MQGTSPTYHVTSPTQFGVRALKVSTKHYRMVLDQEWVGSWPTNYRRQLTALIKTNKLTTSGRRNSAPDREGQFMKSHKLKLNKLAVLTINFTPPIIIATTSRYLRKMTMMTSQ